VARFVLVHGAWLDGSSWAPLARELEARGHKVAAPDLPCEALGLTCDDYAAALPEGDVVVAHSLGGLTLARLAAPARVWVAGLVPVDDLYRVALQPEFRGHTARDEHGRSYWPDAAVAAERLYPDLDAATGAALFRGLRRQAPLDPRPLVAGGRVAYVACARDVAVRPTWQRSVAREALGVAPLELDAGHFCMLTHPRELADALTTVVGS
jgi:pimeloyl-ACP methyl ester carboxylesterase